MINVACIADLHNDNTWLNNPLVAKAHIVIVAGDLFDLNDYARINESFLQMRRNTDGEIVIVAGNHDIFLNRWKPTFRHMEKIHYLEDSGVKILGFNVWGSPWTSQFGPGVFMAGAGERKAKWDLIPADTDILVTHSPPQHYRDLVPDGYAGPGGHKGCAHLHDKVMQIKPKLHVFGHIHEGAGNVKDKGITFVNASRRDRDFNLAWDATIVGLSQTKTIIK